MEVDKYILTEALSAVLGVTVKLQSDCEDLGAITLQIANLTTLALLKNETQPVTCLTSTLTRLFFGDEKKAQEIQEFESASFSLRKELFVISDDFFDPKFDFDFTNMSEPEYDACVRGDEPYKRPYGWMRFALKVKDKYPDGNAWLGTDGWRSHSAPGEWPVSYYGTDFQGAEGIIRSQYIAGDGLHAYGRGIYSSPDINVADVFAQTNFTSQKNGKTYKVIMQNRINPEKREIKNKDIWLVPIPEGTSAKKEKEIVESSIRHYGLLLKKM